MMLADYLLTLPVYELADIYDLLYQPDVPHKLTEADYRASILAYWDDPDHWNRFVTALSPVERQTVTRLALHERHPIDAFLEDLSALGWLILHRTANRYEIPDDVRVSLLERLPTLHDRLQAQERPDEDGTAPV